MEKIIHTLLPRVCSLCGVELSNSRDGVCRGCIRNMEVLHPESRHCLRQGYYVCAVYSGRIAATLIAFKKGRAPTAHRILARIFLPHLQYNLARWPGEKIILTHPPTSIKSLFSRGYDHMKLICKSLLSLHGNDASEGGGPRLELLKLFRRHKSASQKMLDRESRKENIQSAVSLRTDCIGSIHSDTPIIILDDVITTGATLGKCRELLTERGFSRVYCMALLTD